MFGFLPQIVTAISQDFGGDIRSHVQKLGLDSLLLTDLTLTASYSTRGFAVRFAFQALSSTFGNPFIQITMNRLKANSQNCVTITASFTDMKIATVFQTLTELDISFIPVIGKLHFTKLDMIFSTKDLGFPLINYRSNVLQKLTPIYAGIQLIADVKLNGKLSQVKIILSKTKVLFEMVGGSISVTELIDKAASVIGLPPKFSLQSFLEVKISTFEYDSRTKLLILPVMIPEPVIFVPNSFELYNATVIFSKLVNNNPSTGLEFNSVWRLGQYDIPLTIKKSTKLKLFFAESNPKMDIPFGELMTQFMTAILPSGPLEDAVKGIGLESFYIRNPHVTAIFANGMVLKVKGTTVIGDWDKCNVEVLLGKVGGAFVMVTGIELEAVPITKLVSQMTKNQVNLEKLPGSSILDNTNVALTMSSQDVPKINQHMKFTLKSLSKTDILDGVTLVTAFKFPKKCASGDVGCLVSKRLLGADAQLVLRGRLYIASVELSATIPTEIQVFKGVNITDCGLQIEAGVKSRNAIGIKGSLKLKDPDLTFIGSFGLSLSGVFLQMSMAGTWRKPFGVPFLAAGDLNFRIAVIPDPILLSSIEFGGKAEIGLLDNKRAVPIKTALYFGTDRISAMENYCYGSISSLTIPAVLKAFAFTHSLPQPLHEIGFPNGVNVSFAFKSRLLPNGVTISRGFVFSGTVKILFFEANADIKLNLNGIFIDISVKPFKIGNGLVVVSGRSHNIGPRVYTDIGWNPPRAFINIEGKVKVG